MPYIFRTSRITSGNTVFPTTIVIDRHQLCYFKGNLIGETKITVPRSCIASIRLHKGLLFSNLIIETLGGRILYLNGFSNSNGQQIYNLLKNYTLNR